MKLTEKKIKEDTMWSVRYYENLKKRIAEYEEDTKKEVRLHTHECKTCFYLRNGLAGQAFTPYNCRNCNSDEMHHNTAVPKYCVKCSEEHNVCVRCGSEL